MKEKIYRLFYALFHLSLIIIGIISTYDFYSNRNRMSGILMSLCCFIIGIPGLTNNIYEYKQAVQENNDQKANSRLFRITRSGGIVLAGIFGVLSIFLGW